MNERMNDLIPLAPSLKQEGIFYRTHKGSQRLFPSKTRPFSAQNPLLDRHEKPGSFDTFVPFFRKTRRFSKRGVYYRKERDMNRFGSYLTFSSAV